MVAHRHRSMWWVVKKNKKFEAFLYFKDTTAEAAAETAPPSGGAHRAPTGNVGASWDLFWKRRGLCFWERPVGRDHWDSGFTLWIPVFRVTPRDPRGGADNRKDAFTVRTDWTEYIFSKGVKTIWFLVCMFPSFLSDFVNFQGWKRQRAKPECHLETSLWRAVIAGRTAAARMLAELLHTWLHSGNHTLKTHWLNCGCRE